MRESRLPYFWVILETLVTESAEFFRQQQAVIQYVARHCTATTFCPHSLHTQFIAATHIEHRLYHSHFASHTLPIEKMLILLGRQMHKHTFIGTHRVSHLVLFAKFSLSLFFFSYFSCRRKVGKRLCARIILT